MLAAGERARRDEPAADQVFMHGLRWTGREVGDAHDDAGSGVVEFVARHEDGVVHEVSRFEQRAGRWFYVDGVTT